MNKIYRLVFSKISNSLIAVSEISRGSTGAFDGSNFNKAILTALLIAGMFSSNANATCNTTQSFGTIYIDGDCNTGYTLPTGQTTSSIYLSSGASVQGGIVLDGDINTVGANYYGVGFLSGALTIEGGVTNNGTTVVNSGPGVGTSTAENSIDFIQNNGSLTGVNAIENSGSIGVIENNGSLIGNQGISGITSYGIYNFYNSNIGSISNNTLGTITGDAGGIYNYGAIGSVVNSGTISGSTRGIDNIGSIGSLINNSGALIEGQRQGIWNYTSTSAITTLNNSGSIIALSYEGIRNDGTIGALNNAASGIIRGQDSGIVNYGTSSVITSFNNSGTISGLTYFGVANEGSIGTINNASGAIIRGQDAGIFNYSPSSVITTLNNSGTISGLTTIGIQNDGAIGSINNAVGGLIRGQDAGILNNDSSSVITTLNNSGTISGLTTQGIQNNGSIDTVINSSSGSMIGQGSGFYNKNSASHVAVFSNFGSITGLGFQGIDNEGSIGTISNAAGASIAGAGVGIANRASSVITTLNNSGAITGNASHGIHNYGNINLIANFAGGAISGANGLYAGLVNDVAGSIAAVNNDGGMISAGGAGVANYGSIAALNNLNGGNIIASYGVSNAGTGLISSINNGANSFIQGASGDAILNDGKIASIINAGVISAGGGLFFGIANNGSISEITNYGAGTIAGSGSATIPGIQNNGTINTLNVGGNSALQYGGALPSNLNLIVSGPSIGKFSAVSVTGATNFGIYSGGVNGVPASVLSRGTYSSVLTGLTSNNITGATSGNYNGFTWTLNNSSSGIWDLIVKGASTADTQQSLAGNVAALQSTYTLQNSVLANSFSYDCSVFGVNNICVSAGGRNTAVSATNGLNNTSALLIAAYRLHANYRIGAYADQNLSVNNAGSIVNLGNNTPLIGIFGAWQERLDGTGAEVKVSAAYGQKNTTISRQVIGTSEAGSGSSQLISQGAQITAKYGFGMADHIVTSPYAGIRYTQNNMGGYTEGISTSVTAPLTYSALNTNATTALAGLGASYRGIAQTTLFASAGVESDMNTSNGTYSATGIVGLTPISFNANPVKTRPTASVGAYYDIEKNQRLGVAGIYRQEPYQSVSTTTVIATYTIGL